MGTKPARQANGPSAYCLGAKTVIVRESLVLLAGYDDETGLHTNFPGGGSRGDNSIQDGLKRGTLEETC